MTTSAWIFMISVWSVVVYMTVKCFARLLKLAPNESLLDLPAQAPDIPDDFHTA